MELQFRNVITLILFIGFFATLGVIVLADIFVFGIEPSESKMAYLLVGSLVGSIGSVVAVLYEKEKSDVKNA